MNGNDDIDWTTSSYTGSAGTCVEIGEREGRILVRNSNDPDGGTVEFTRAEIQAFVLGVKAGEFDRFGQ